MIEVVVYIKEDYSVNESFFVNSDSSREYITNEVKKRFKEWYSFDVI